MADYRKKFFNDKANKSKNGLYKCVRCGRKFTKNQIDVDHIIPQSLGGSDDLGNLQCLCVHCNRSKGNDISHTLDDLKDNSYNRMSVSEKRRFNKAVESNKISDMLNLLKDKK